MKMSSHPSNLTVLLDLNWLTDTSNGYMLTKEGYMAYATWSKTTKNVGANAKLFSEPVEELETIIDRLYDLKYIADVWNTQINAEVVIATSLGYSVFKTIEYYIDTELQDEVKQTEVEKLEKSVKDEKKHKRNKSIKNGLSELMGGLTNIMVKISQSQNPEPKKQRRKKKRYYDNKKRYHKRRRYYEEDDSPPPPKKEKPKTDYTFKTDDWQRFYKL